MNRVQNKHQVSSEEGGWERTLTIAAMALGSVGKESEGTARNL